MSATPDMLAIFYEPTPPSEIRQRQGPGGRTLDYIDARYVMDTLDKLGPENWQDRYEPIACRRLGPLRDRDQRRGRVDLEVGLRHQSRDIEPQKGSHSEAFKRAGVKWGIARDLYGHTTQARGGSSRRERPSRPGRCLPLRRSGRLTLTTTSRRSPVR
jgi:hypothetical protein